MARRAEGSVRLKLDVVESNTAAGAAAATAVLPHGVLFERACATGTAAGQIDRVYGVASQALTTTPTDIDLAGSLASALDSGVTVVFIELQWLYIQNTGANDITLGGDAADFGPTGTIPAGGCLFMDFGTAGFAIGAGATDILQLAAAASTTTARILVCGRSA